jgi:hypothetical protein
MKIAITEEKYLESIPSSTIRDRPKTSRTQIANISGAYPGNPVTSS